MGLVLGVAVDRSSMLWLVLAEVSRESKARGRVLYAFEPGMVTPYVSSLCHGTTTLKFRVRWLMYLELACPLLLLKFGISCLGFVFIRQGKRCQPSTISSKCVRILVTEPQENQTSAARAARAIT